MRSANKLSLSGLKKIGGDRDGEPKVLMVPERESPEEEDVQCRCRLQAVACFLRWRMSRSRRGEEQGWLGG